ncbi:MAG: hypothetical protein VR64_05030 [Desulfatitalea sp. BRH_c12]|nr:MAG: hypothetical protein VR64_05030 [Desulfatitalea sp. BRH_c12]
MTHDTTNRNLIGRNSIIFKSMRYLAGTFLCALLLAAFTPLDSIAAQVTLQWDPSTGATVSGYRLFGRAAGQAYNYNGPSWEGATTTCTINQLASNKVYYFVVRAYDSQGNESANSNEVVFRTSSISGASPNATPPAAPSAQIPSHNALDVPLDADLATSAFSGSAAGDTHKLTRWQVFRGSDDECVFDLYSDAYLTQTTLPPLVLEGLTDYYWTSQHFNQTDAASAPAASCSFTTAEWAADDNANGIPDSQELLTDTDLDQDGHPDADQANLKCFMSALGDQQIGVSATSSSGTVRLEAAQGVDPSTVSVPAGPSPTLPAGLFNVRMAIDQPGETVMVTLYFAHAISQQERFAMFDPALGYVDYSGTFVVAEDGQSASCQMQDGGEGDMDGVANGTIVTMGGYGTLPSAGLSDGGSSSGGGGGCFIGSLLGR